MNTEGVGGREEEKQSEASGWILTSPGQMCSNVVQKNQIGFFDKNHVTFHPWSSNCRGIFNKTEPQFGAKKNNLTRV